MGGWMDGWMMDRWVDGQMGKWMDGQIEGWKDG